MDVQRRLEVVEQENRFLLERVAALEAALVQCAVLPLEWRLTAAETRVFGALVNREVATKDTLMMAAYSDRITEEEVPAPKIVDVFICKIRRKLKPFGIEIGTVWGQGYTLPAEIRTRYRHDTARAA